MATATVTTSATANRAPKGLPGKARPLRRDLRLIADLVDAESRVLDVGCDDGALLAHLAETKNVDARGIELSQAGVQDCVSRGLAVVQGDAEKDLQLYPDGSFDYVILSQTIQAMRQPRDVLDAMLRIGRFGIVSFTNYAHWRSPLASSARAHAESERVGRTLVCDGQYPSLHPGGFRASMRRAGIDDRQADLPRPPGTSQPSC